MVVEDQRARGHKDQIKCACEINKGGFNAGFVGDVEAILRARQGDDLTLHVMCNGLSDAARGADDECTFHTIGNYVESRRGQGALPPCCRTSPRYFWNDNELGGFLLDLGLYVRGMSICAHTLLLLSLG